MAECEVRKAFEQQAVWCDRLGSPFTAQAMRILANMLDRTTATGRRVLDWHGQPDAGGDAVPLRVAGALHTLARSREAPDLTAVYPPNPPSSDADLRRGLAGALRTHDAAIARWLDRAPQTNEVARAAMLYAGLVTIAAETHRDLAIFEIGASAGLNLLLDRFGYTLGGRPFGDPRSAVHLAPVWSGPAPAGPDPIIVARRGCDIAPVDIADPAARERLAGYVWPDQRERLARIEHALEIAATMPPVVDAADAADWVEHQLAAAPPSRTTRVLLHSIALQYVSESGRNRISEAMARLGRAATAAAPLAWLSFEQAQGGPELRLTVWPGGMSRKLATADAHVRRVVWNETDTA